MDLTILNPQQRQAVEATEGPLLILAGAGSGKTRVLTHRIAYLIEEKQVAPYHILALTFTNKAAKEMRDRIARLVSDGAGSIWMHTFHGFCARILSMEIEALGFDRKFSIYDDTDTQSLIGHIIKDMNLNDKIYTKRMLAGIFSGAKNHSLNPEAHLQAECQPQQIIDAFRMYQSRLHGANALDFDDLLLYAIELFEKFPDVLEKYRDKFRYILVDEYQDTNLAQYHIVSMLAKEHRNICVVGDDDQSIYGWRGADVRNILEFEKDFPGATVIRLEQNYRSTEKILACANAVIKNNDSRKEKSLWTEEKGGAPVTVAETENERDEAALICSNIASAVRKGARYDDFAILYRTHAQSRIMEILLNSYNIPYRVFGGTSFFARAEVKDIIAYFRLLHNPSDNEAFLRVVNVPRRGIGAVAIQELRDFAAQRDEPLFAAVLEADELTSRAKTRFVEFGSLISGLFAYYSTHTLSEFASELLEEIGYEQYLREDKKENYETREEIVLELLGYVSEFEKQFNDPDDDVMHAFLSNIALFSNQDAVEEENGCVSLMTLHTAKGLEFPNVFICGLENALFPSSKSMYDPIKLEEERRLCYVGITRAMKQLTLCYARERTIYGKTEYTMPSMFLEEMRGVVELPSRKSRVKEYTERAASVKLPVFGQGKVPTIPIAAAKPVAMPAAKDFSCSVGDRVRHKAFGEGTVVSLDGAGTTQIVQIVFDNKTEKKFAAAYAPIERL